MAKVQAGQLPVARQVLLGDMKAALYYLFWQAYTGKIALKRFQQRFAPARRLRPLLRALAATGYLEMRGDSVSLTGRGYDRYHDLERWITYHFIEPLWRDMMNEHHGAAGLRGQAASRQGRFWRWLAGLRPVTRGWMGNGSGRCAGAGN